MQKYGRTYHLPISPGATSDDKTLRSIAGLQVPDLVVTEKMDGENTTLHAAGCHARSPDGRNHPSRDWVKAFAAGISPRLADSERIVGENLFARHAIAYDDLPSFFLGFAWIVAGEVQPWDDTLRRFEGIGITPVPTLYRGPYSETLFEDLARTLDTSQKEGFVARTAASFAETDMQTRIGKYVRAGHVQSEVHWMNAPLVPNKLR